MKALISILIYVALLSDSIYTYLKYRDKNSLGFIWAFVILLMVSLYLIFSEAYFGLTKESRLVEFYVTTFIRILAVILLGVSFIKTFKDRKKEK
jgi:uncharacterized membrane protein